MNHRERLIKTLHGEAVDRPAVSFYEIGMIQFDPEDADPFNVHNDPSWRSLIDLAETRTDIMRSVWPKIRFKHPEVRAKYIEEQQWIDGESKFSRVMIKINGRELTQLSRRDADVDTIWIIEHLLKGADDLLAYLDVPDEAFEMEVDCSGMQGQLDAIGDAGIGLIDVGDPLCTAAALFDMDIYTVMAFTEGRLFHELLAKVARTNMPRYEQIARECPGQLWRIYGPEYASEPYLPPALFDEYVVEYDRVLVDTIKRHEGFARLHSHGWLKNILPLIDKLNIDGLDPIEPTGQGDVELIDVRREYGAKWVLFGNIEIADLENLETEQFRQKVRRALEEGTSGQGRGFVLMPSSCPYGRVIDNRTIKNYQAMVSMAESFAS